jgi:hypothetical protein
MNNSTNTTNSMNELANFVSKHEISIILLIFTIFFYVIAVVKKIPLVGDFDTNVGIRKGFFIMGCVTFTISIILLANEFDNYAAKHGLSIILLIFTIFFFFVAVEKKLPWGGIFDVDAGIRKGFFLMGCVIFTISMILLANKQPPLPPSNPTPNPTLTPRLNTSKAIDLIEKYLLSKNNVFGRSHSTDEVDKYSTG